MFKTVGISASVITGLITIPLAVGTLAQLLPVRVDRWLEVRQLAGQVILYRGQQSQPATLNARLQSVGDAIATGRDSSATLVVDTGIGVITVSENTAVRVQRLRLNPNGARITQLQITGGQARLRLRQFTNPDSQLEIETPAGISGVRGTTFGVSVQPDGKTGVATLEGSVFAAAQGETVVVDGGLQSLIVPGEPPTPPAPLQEDTTLALQLLTALDSQVAQVMGRIDPVNLLMIEDQPQIVDRTGFFNLQVPLPPDRRINAVVITPLGKRQVYELAVP